MVVGTTHNSCSNMHPLPSQKLGHEVSPFSLKRRVKVSSVLSKGTS